MKLGVLSLTLLSFSTLLPLAPSFTSSASACSETAYGVQVRVSGEKNPKAAQNYNANQTSDDNCLNNNVVSGSRQISIGEKAPEQNINIDQHVGGGNINQTGIKTPTVKTNVNIQNDVYSPAHDPEFMNEMMQKGKR